MCTEGLSVGFSWGGFGILWGGMERISGFRGERFWAFVGGCGEGSGLSWRGFRAFVGRDCGEDLGLRRDSGFRREGFGLLWGVIRAFVERISSCRAFVGRDFGFHGEDLGLHGDFRAFVERDSGSCGEVFRLSWGGILGFRVEGCGLSWGGFWAFVGSRGLVRKDSGFRGEDFF